MSEPNRFNPTIDCEREKFRCKSCRDLGRRVLNQALVEAGRDFSNAGVLSDFLASGVQTIVDQTNPLYELDAPEIDSATSIEGCLSRREKVIEVAVELARNEIVNPRIGQ